MPNNLDGDVTKSYRMNTHLCLNVFCVGWHLAAVLPLLMFYHQIWCFERIFWCLL